eukprot:m.156053 g.156053  ORF g.156053 m.156053 type:complete len:232 (-) comp15093_c0_seq10:1187-1882(-)
MSLLHLKPRKQAIKEKKKEEPPKRFTWKLDGHLIEILKPKEAPGLCETSMHGGVFVDGNEVVRPGLLRNRVGFIFEGHHIQLLHNGFNFANPRGRKGGKFILCCDGWEVDTRTPINLFFLRMYRRVFLVGLLQFAISLVGILSLFLAHNKALNSFVVRLLLVFLPLGLYYMYYGVTRLTKYALRLRTDAVGDPWWEPESDMEQDEAFRDAPDDIETGTLQDDDDLLLPINS